MRRYEFKTMLDPLEQRFGKKMAAVLFLPALTGEIFWTAAILMALGTTFGTVLGLATTPAIILSAIIAIAYTALGGLWAVALTDVVQIILLIGGLFLVGSAFTKKQLLKVGMPPTLAALSAGVVGGVMQSLAMTPAGMIFTSLNSNRGTPGHENDTAWSVTKELCRRRAFWVCTPAIPPW